MASVCSKLALLGPDDCQFLPEVLAADSTLTMSDLMQREAFVTLVTSESYVVGAVVLADSLRGCCGDERPMVCMVTDVVSDESRRVLKGAGMRVEEVTPIASPGTSEIAAWNQSGYTKLNLWQLTQYSKLVYVDADCLVVASMNDLFERVVDFAAAPDTFPPDRFNAGVLLLRPSLAVFDDMMTKIATTPTYDGGDTGFLNAYFDTWYSLGPEARLPFGYNALRTMYWLTQKNPGYWQAAEPIKCIHYCSFPKPWYFACP